MVLTRLMRNALLAASAALVLHGAAGAATPPVEASRYVVSKSSGEELALARPVLPDLSPYTRGAVETKIVKSSRAKVTVSRMVNEIVLSEFVGGRDRLAEWAARQNTNPVAIFVEGGYITPKDLAAQLPDKYFQETEPGVFIARLPLVVRTDATLHIGPEVRDFRLSEERGAFLVNDGMLFVIGSRLTAWRERSNGAARFQGDGESFRPFLVSWGGAEAYIVDSVVTSLGYSASKSYGISISQYSPGVDAVLHRPRPKGWILNSEFVDLWFGFYCYEADDLVVVGNTYRDSIVYGIDPHDRSRRLIIAHNTVHGTKQKHGIIASREVSDSWVFGNRSFDNRLSGIVLDRSCSRNVLAQNDASNNGADGITIYESPDNLIWENRAVANNRHGIRLRNSVDIRLYDNLAAANRLTGVYGHTKDLTGTDRDLKLDPFELSVSMTVVGGRLLFNGSGPVMIDQPLSVEFYGVDMLAPTKKAGIQMRGVLGAFQNEILDIVVRQRAAAIIKPTTAISANQP